MSIPKILSCNFVLSWYKTDTLQGLYNMYNLNIKHLLLCLILSITQSLASSSEEFDYYSDNDYDEEVYPLKRSASLSPEDLECQPEEKKAKVEAIYIEGQYLCLMDLNRNLLLLMIDCIQSMTDQVAFSLTCKLALGLVNSLPYAPKYFMPIFPRIVNPEIMYEVTVDEFIGQLELDTVFGRKRFCKTFTIEGFSKMLDSLDEGKFLLDSDYLSFLNAARAFTGRGFYVNIDNPVHMFPEHIFFHVFKVLKLRKSESIVLPRAVKNLSEVENFLCTDTMLRFLPTEVCSLRTIKIFNLACSNLMSLPTGFQNLCNLHKLNLRGALLREIPAEVLELPNLKHLDMSNNWLTEVPFYINKLKKLEVLNLSNAAQFNCPKGRNEAEQGARNSFEELPLTFVELTNLQTLNLESTGLVRLPVGFNRLTNLTSLNLASNQLAEIPPPLLKMNGLITLDMSCNQLNMLPAELAGLSALVTLQVQGNNIACVPNAFRENKQLQLLGAVWYMQQSDNH